MSNEDKLNPNKTSEANDKELSAAEWLERAQEEEDCDNTQTALVAVKKALKLDPNLSEAWRLKASLLLDMDRHREAFDTLNEACSRLPQNPGCWFDMGAFLATHNELVQATHCYMRVHQLDSKFPRINTNLGMAFMKLGDFEHAAQFLPQAVEESLNDKDKALALGRLGEAYLNMGEFDKAFERLDQSLLLDDKDYVTLSNMAMVHLQRNEYEPGLKAIKAAIELAPKDATLRLMLATILDSDGHFEEAEKSIQEALKLAPDQPEVWTKASSRYHALSKNSEDKEEREALDKKAIEYLEQATKVQPDRAEVWVNTANCYISLANDYLNTTKHDEMVKRAIAHLEKASKVEPGNFQVWHSMGFLLCQMKDFTERALECFENSIQLNPNFPGNWLAKAQILHKQGKEQEAGACQRRGLLLAGELVVWGLFLIDDSNNPVEGTQIAIETQRSVPQNKIAEQYIAKLKEQNHQVDEQGVVDGKFRIAMTQLPLDQIPLDALPEGTKDTQDSAEEVAESLMSALENKEE